MTKKNANKLQSVSTMERVMIQFFLMLLLVTSGAEQQPLEGVHLTVILEHASLIL